MGPELPFSEHIHSTKYRQDGESFRDYANRVASALEDSPEHYRAFRDCLLDMRFLPGGRIQAAVGSAKAVTPYNCYLSGTIEDNFCGTDGIMARATEAAETTRMGGGIGFDFSGLRPRGTLIRTLQSAASGPVSFMGIYDAVCDTVASAGHRRGAMMAVLRVDHPDILDYIHAKQSSRKAPTLWKLVEEMMEEGDPRAATAFAELQTTNALTGFNTSIAVTNEFMEAVNKGTDFDLRWGDRIYSTVDARELWEQIMRSTWDWAEPGVLFIDHINDFNNLWYCERIYATNPCGEQPLPPYGACLLGSFNLTKYVKKNQIYQVGKEQYYFDWEQLIADIPHVVRAMDNVIDKAKYPLVHQQYEAKDKRRMGLGVTGMANAGEALGFVYGSEQFLTFEQNVLNLIANACYRTGALLAKEKGPFKLFDAKHYLKSKFIGTLDDETRQLIAKYGVRNSHYTSIAPTGTISIAANYVSSGIEPVFEYKARRTVKAFEGDLEVEVEDYGHRVFGVEGKTASQCTAEDHLNVLSTAYQGVDSAVSKTINMNSTMPWDDFKDIYWTAWERGCKGCTTFNSDGKRMGILKATPKDEEQVCFIDTETGRKECI